MAVLHSKNGGVTMTLRPYKVLEEGEPTLLLTQIEMQQVGKTLLSTTITMARQDLALLIAGLGDMAAGQRNDFAVTTIDDDLMLTTNRMQLTDDVAIGFWVGEPYGLMSGYRFVVLGRNLLQFAVDLRSDEVAIGRPTGLS